jgi:hypothetical protein
MVYPALLPLTRTPRLPAADWTDAPTDLNGLVRFGERRNLISACVPSHSKSSLLKCTHTSRTRSFEPHAEHSVYVCACANAVQTEYMALWRSNISYQCNMLRLRLQSFGNEKGQEVFPSPCLHLSGIHTASCTAGTRALSRGLKHP